MFSTVQRVAFLALGIFSCLIGTLPAFGDALLNGFENTLATTNGNAEMNAIFGTS